MGLQMIDASHNGVRTLWVRSTDKIKFLAEVTDLYVREVSEPCFVIIEGPKSGAFHLAKYHGYIVNIADDECLILMLRFDIKDSIDKVSGR